MMTGRCPGAAQRYKSIAQTARGCESTPPLRRLILGHPSARFSLVLGWFVSFGAFWGHRSHRRAAGDPCTALLPDDRWSSGGNASLSFVEFASKPCAEKHVFTAQHSGDGLGAARSVQKAYEASENCRKGRHSSAGPPLLQRSWGPVLKCTESVVRGLAGASETIGKSANLLAPKLDRLNQELGETKAKIETAGKRVSDVADARAAEIAGELQNLSGRS
jgi:hypothetical protein